MKLIIYILLWISFFTSCYCTDFNHLQNFLESNSKELEMQQISVAISKKDLNIIESENYPSISLGANLEDAKSLTNSSESVSVGDNNLITDSAKKNYSYLGLNYNVYSFGRLETKSNSQKHQIEVAKYDYCQQKNDLNLKLLEFYSNALIYQLRIETFETIVEEKNRIYELKENSYRFGLNLTISLFDEFKTISQKEKVLLELKQLQTKYNLEKARFGNEILISNQNFQFDKSNLENRLQNIQLTSLNQTNTTKLQNIGVMARIETINSNIEKINKELDYKLNEVKLAYEFNKRKILIEDEKCIVY